MEDNQVQTQAAEMPGKSKVSWVKSGLLYVGLYVGFAAVGAGGYWVFSLLVQ